jgi:hypothetical protein
MMMRTMTIAAAGVLLLHAGCDAKAGDDYQGEPLLSFEGSVRLASTQIEGELEPAIAFVPTQSRLEILDVEVRGSFPANFTLDVLAPPAKGALTSARAYIREAPKEQKLALGYITAVAADHPSEVRMAEGGGYKYECEGGVTDLSRSGEAPPEHEPEDGVRDPWDWERHILQVREMHRGNNPGAACTEEFFAIAMEPDRTESILYRQISKCDYKFESCEIISSQGDPKYLRSPFEKVAGLSSNYLVLYLPGAVEADSPVARAFGGGPLAAGYHLLEAESDQTWSDEYIVCIQTVDVLSLYNAKHGTNFTQLNELGPALLPIPAPDDPSFNEVTNSPEYIRGRNALEDELTDLESAAIASECKDLQPVLARPVDPSGRSISIQIAPTLTPPELLAPQQFFL